MKSAIIILLAILLGGCATSKVATDIGSNIGESFASTAEKGVPAADQILKAWPYISGQIKGLAGEEYKTKIVPASVEVITELDALAAKTNVTMEEQGKAVGLVVRLEYLAGKYFYQNYGVGLFTMIKTAAGGALMRLAILILCAGLILSGCATVFGFHCKVVCEKGY